MPVSPAVPRVHDRESTLVASEPDPPRAVRVEEHRHRVTTAPETSPIAGNLSPRHAAVHSLEDLSRLVAGTDDSRAKKPAMCRAHERGERGELVALQAFTGPAERLPRATTVSRGEERCARLVPLISDPEPDVR